MTQLAQQQLLYRNRCEAKIMQVEDRDGPFDSTCAWNYASANTSKVQSVSCLSVKTIYQNISQRCAIYLRSTVYIF